MNDYITQAKDKTQTDSFIDEYYTYTGKEDFIDDNNNLRRNQNDEAVAAKKIYRDKNRYKLMIKCDRHGKPFDPNDQLSYNRTVDSYKSGYKFIEVNIKAFNHYINFLKTQNKSWLLNTERELT